MNLVSCNVIEDLIPLYVEDMLSEDSKKLVEAHLDKCEECRGYLEELKEIDKLPIETDTEPLRKIQKTLQKKKWTTTILTTLIALFIGALSVIYITAPKYLPYSEEVVTVSETDNGLVFLAFNEEVAGYNFQSYTTQNGEGLVYHLIGWSTTWHDLTNTGEIDPIVLNSNGEEVEAVYYYQTNETADQLVYGKEQHADGGIITLPRLSLNYFSVFAMIVFILCIGILFTVHSTKTYFHRMIKISGIPFSYLLAQLLVTGWEATTYSLVRDFTAIMLVAVLLYGVFWVGYETLKKRSLN